MLTKSLLTVLLAAAALPAAGQADVKAKDTFNYLKRSDIPKEWMRFSFIVYDCPGSKETSNPLGNAFTSYPSYEKLVEGRVAQGKAQAE